MLEPLGAALTESDEPDDALREAVRIIAAQPGIAWAAIAFVDEERLTVGPSSGTADEQRRVKVPITYRDAPVGELWVDGDADHSLLEQAAQLLAEHVLIGWDTGGEPWDP